MGNGIFGRMAANRQGRIQRRNNNCCQSRVYYCQQPVVQHCRPRVAYSQAQVVYNQPQVIHSEPKTFHAQPKLQQSIKKESKIELNFNSLKQNTINSNTDLGQWLNNKRQDTEVNMFKIGDVHIMEIHSNSPKLQFFDKAGNKWQSLSQKQTLEFYQSKEKFQSQETTNTEENKMTGVIGNNPTQTNGLINRNEANSNAGAGARSEADASSKSNSGAGASSTSSSNPDVTIVNTNVQPSKSSSSGGIDVYEKKNANGSTEKSISLGNGESFIQNSGSISIGDVTLFGTNNHGRKSSKQSSKGHSSLIGRDAKKNGAVGTNASNNGMSKKEKKQLRKLLNRNFKASLNAASTAQKAVDASKKALKASNKSSANSDAAKTASEQTQEALSKLPNDVKNTVRGAIKELNKRLEKARVDLKADQSDANKDQLVEIQKFAKAYLGKLDKIAPDLAEKIAPLIRIDVPDAKVPEINLNLKIEEFEIQPVQPQQKATPKNNVLIDLAA